MKGYKNLAGVIAKGYRQSIFINHQLHTVIEISTSFSSLNIFFTLPNVPEVDTYRNGLVFDTVDQETPLPRIDVDETVVHLNHLKVRNS